MANREITSSIAPSVVYGPIVATADNTPTAIDLQGYDAAVILLAIGVGGITFDTTNKIEFKLQHSDDNVTYVDVAYTDLTGAAAPTSALTTGIIKSLTSAHAAAAVYEFGYVGSKRYLKLLNDFSGTHAVGTPIAHVIVKAKPSLASA